MGWNFVIIKSSKDYHGIVEAAEVLSYIFGYVERNSEPGMTTIQLDEMIGDLIEACDASPAPIVFYDFPGNSCISVNNEIAHGVPSDYIIQEWDVVKVDISILHDNGYCSDACRTLYWGDSPLTLDLIRSAKRCVNDVVCEIIPTDSVHRIGGILEKSAQRNEMYVVENLYGHGIGRSLHEFPQIPHVFECLSCIDDHRLSEWEVICVEPVLSYTRTRVLYDKERHPWAYYSDNGSITAQHEDTIVLTEYGAMNLTA